MNKKACIIGFILILLLALSGCLDFLSTNGSGTLYESHPTKISYTISYGYRINCNGIGEHTIQYDCDVPEMLNGQILSITVLNDQYEDKQAVATYNDMKSWNFSKSSCTNYELGITADVIAKSFIVSDLNGGDALTIQDIENRHPDLISQYCQAQSNETTAFIDPDDSDIKNKALEILNNANTNNAFILAKKIFIWLKQNTFYQIHPTENTVQPACITIKGKTGDCDDLSFLYISLCRSLNIPARFIRGFLVEENNAIPHAWVEVFVGENIGDKGWIPVECAGRAEEIEAEINQNFGIESVEHLRLFKDDGSNKSLIISLSGISYLADQTLDIEQPVFFAEVSNYKKVESNELFIDENGIRTYI